jgi:hypothetical protein
VGIPKGWIMSQYDLVILNGTVVLPEVGSIRMDDSKAVWLTNR